MVLVTFQEVIEIASFLKAMWDVVYAFWRVALAGWWLFIPSFLTLAIRLAMKVYRYRQDLRTGLAQIDDMTGERFEEWLAAFFVSRGYRVRLTPRTGDYGVDLRISRDGQTAVVQAKRWRGRVGVKAVQEVFAGKTHYGADSALIVTNSYFTYEARNLASSTGVELWDRTRLRKEILSDQRKRLRAG